MCLKYNYLKATRNYIAIIYNYNKKGFLSVELCCVCFASLYQQEFCNYRPEGSWQELFSLAASCGEEPSCTGPAGQRAGSRCRGTDTAWIEKT